MYRLKPSKLTPTRPRTVQARLPDLMLRSGESGWRDPIIPKLPQNPKEVQCISKVGRLGCHALAHYQPEGYDVHLRFLARSNLTSLSDESYRHA